MGLNGGVTAGSTVNASRLLGTSTDSSAVNALTALSILLLLAALELFQALHVLLNPQSLMF